MVVVNADDGKVVTTLPIGDGRMAPDLTRKPGLLSARTATER